MKAEALAPSNIAFVKYWGKKDEANIPMNPSISMTLDENISTRTTVEFSKDFKADMLILNNKDETGIKLDRVIGFLDLAREKAGTRLRAKVISENSFPTGAGIASSASGFAALALASSKALALNLDKRELSAFARMGSGSAARSIHGGFVFWEGEYAVQLKEESHWPELVDLVIIVEQAEKKISSRDAMRLTLDTEAYRRRIANLGRTIEAVKKAILEKDFVLLAQSIMTDSDSMHACIEETGIRYLTGRSQKIKEKIKYLNKSRVIAAYTFDAGPNAHIITTKENLRIIKEELESFGKMIISGVGRGIQ
jgi:diphosphomevalonate decarboxylase